MIKLLPIYALLASFFLVAVTSNSAQAQNTKSGEYTEMMYENSLSGGIQAHTRGWGILGRYFKYKTVNRSQLYEVSFLAALKHPKEVKVINQAYENARPYIYGKKNHLMVLKGGIGNQHIIADREQALGIKVQLHYTIGPNLGMLKPVYLEIVKPDPDNPSRATIKTERYDPETHDDQSLIHGGASFFSEGFDEMSFIPGASGKAGLAFDWGNDETEIKNLEAGVMVDAFPKNVPIFAHVQNKKLFINLYLSLTFGSRW